MAHYKDVNMEYRKIIPCVTMENPIEEARFYNDSGADEVAFFDSTASRESLDKNIPIIKEITRNINSGRRYIF